jgi:hypothetical protein
MQIGANSFTEDSDGFLGLFVSLQDSQIAVFQALIESYDNLGSVRTCEIDGRNTIVVYVHQSQVLQLQKVIKDICSNFSTVIAEPL